MSTSRSRLTRSIQEIAKRDPDLRRAIEATKPRGDQPSAAGVGTSDAERDRVCCDGSVSGDANPGTDTRDTSEGGQDGLNPDDAADISDMGPGSLTGLHDCATGEPVCFDGADWVPPEGWGSPTDPPIKDGWEISDQHFWTAADCSGNTQRYRTAGQAVAMLGGITVDVNNDCPGPYEVVDTRRLNPTAWQVIYRYNPVVSRQANRVSCDGQPQAIKDQWCGTDYGNPTPEEQREDSWPSDSCVNLAIKGGSIVGSKYDPENDGTYSKPMSEIQLCDDFGNSFYLRPSSSGGWKTINATKTAGYLWSSTGQKIAHIDGNEYSDPSI